MKISVLVLVFALVTGAAAQQRDRTDFLNVFNYAFRVAQTPCPTAFTDMFEEPTCYLHGYDDFFDFKMRYGQFFSDVSQGKSSYWHTVALDLGNESATAFRSRHTLRAGRLLTVTYLDSYIVLEFAR